MGPTDCFSGPWGPTSEKEDPARPQATTVGVSRACWELRSGHGSGSVSLCLAVPKGGRTQEELGQTEPLRCVELRSLGRGDPHWIPRADDMLGGTEREGLICRL